MTINLWSAGPSRELYLELQQMYQGRFDLAEFVRRKCTQPGVEHPEPFQCQPIAFGQRVDILLGLEDEPHDFPAFRVGQPRDLSHDLRFAHGRNLSPHARAAHDIL